MKQKLAVVVLMATTLTGLAQAEEKRFTEPYYVQGTVIQTKIYNPPLELRGEFHGQRINYLMKVKSLLYYLTGELLPIPEDQVYFGYVFQFTEFYNMDMFQISRGDRFYASVMFAERDHGRVSTRGVYLKYSKSKLR